MRLLTHIGVACNALAAPLTGSTHCALLRVVLRLDGLPRSGTLALNSADRREAQEEIGGEVNESEMCEGKRGESEKRDGMEFDDVVDGEASGWYGRRRQSQCLVRAGA
jgi:hypothetical protein